MTPGAPPTGPLPPGPTPVVLIGGFLGAGKTSALNHLLRQSGGRRVAALVNDFGAINLDADLVVALEGEVLRLAGGCLCCRVRGRLVETALAALAAEPRPDLLVVETSGVADTAAVVETFLQPELRALFQVSAILGLVDAAQFAQLPDETLPLAEAQLAAADLVVLNKIDLVEPAGLAELKRRIAAIAPGAPLVEAFHGRMPPELVFGRDPAGRAGRRKAGGPALHDHLASCHWQSAQALSLARLRAAFEALSRQVYRAKGIVRLDDLPGRRVLLQTVGRRQALSDLGPWGAEAPESRVLMIGQAPAFDEAEIVRRLEGCIVGEGEAASPLKALMQRLG